MEPLILPMMMYGKYKDYVKEKDPITGKWKTVYETTKTGKKKAKKKWIIHDESKGDPGFYPSVNHIYQNTRGGGKKLTQAAERLFEKWHALAHLWALDNDWNFDPQEKVVLEITCFFPDKQKRDASNAIKLMMDALEGVLYQNDYYALPRIMDFQVLEDKSIAPYFKVVIYKKDEEKEVLKDRIEELAT